MQWSDVVEAETRKREEPRVQLESDCVMPWTQYPTEDPPHDVHHSFADGFVHLMLHGDVAPNGHVVLDDQ